MNKLTMEQIQILIEFVRARPGLYDRKHLSFKNAEMKARHWKELSLLLSTEERDCKVAWRSLKDHFTKRWKEYRYKTGRAAEDMLRRYKHFESLLFLKDSVFTKKQRNNYDESNALEFENVTPMCGKDENSNASSREFLKQSGHEFGFECPSTSYTVSTAMKRGFSPQSEQSFEFEANSCTTTTMPAPEMSPIDSTVPQQHIRPGSHFTSSTKILKLDISEQLSSLLGKREKPEETEQPDNIDMFFQAIAKSVKRFNFSELEQSKLMMDTTQLLNKIVADRQQ